MASLNTLRTRFGVVLSIIIAFALLAFILSLKTDMGLSGNDPKVGVIDGSKIKYSEYIEVYNNLKDQSNISESNEEQMDQLAEMAWQTLIANHVYLPGFEKMGISVTDAEREGLISGEYYSGTMAAAFTDPRTGQYSVEGVSDFIAQATGNPQMQYMWGALVGQAMREREINKYNGLVKGGVYVNRLEAEEGVDAQNKTFSGSWVGKRYHDMPDSLFSVSDSEIKAYYNSHKARYEQKPSRTLSYVVFEVAPSAEDMATLEKTVREVGDEFAASDDPKAFAKNNRFGKITDNYRSVAQLLDDEAEALANGKQYGPVLKNDTWTMTRVVETLNAPDSVGVRHIVLTYDQRDLADSLMTALRQGADFAQAARTHSLYMQDAGNGGDAGVMPFSAFPDELSGLLSTAKQGDILRVEVGDVIQIYRFIVWTNLRSTCALRRSLIPLRLRRRPVAMCIVRQVFSLSRARVLSMRSTRQRIRETSLLVKRNSRRVTVYCRDWLIRVNWCAGHTMPRWARFPRFSLWVMTMWSRW